MANGQPPASRPSPETRPQAGAAGVGSGTLLVLLAQNLPDDNPAKSWLLILAPSATLVVAYLWSLMRSAIEDFAAQRSARIAFRQAEQTLQAVINDPNASAAHKADARKSLEQIQRDYTANTTSRFRARLKDYGKPR